MTRAVHAAITSLVALAACSHPVATTDLEGRVVDAHGTGVPDATLVLESRVLAPAGWIVQTGRDGRFALRGVPVGAHAFRVYRRNLRLGTAAPAADVRAGAALELRVEALDGVIRGTVRDESGVPVLGESVLVLRFAPAAEGAAPATTDTGLRGMTGADGAFVVQQVPAGRYRLELEQRHASEVVDVPGGAVTIVAPPPPR